MRRLALSTLGLLMAGTALAVVPAMAPVAAQPPPVARQGVVVEPQSGRDIYRHTTNTDYRTGPALVRTSDSGLYQYTCGPGPDGKDQIRATFSSDAGGTWLPEHLALVPGPAGSNDTGGTCDPTVAKIGGSYYLAYTGTSATGLKRIYLARAGTLSGPFTTKWNGTDWNGGPPAPLTTAATGTGNTEASGASLVVQGNTVYLYYHTRITTGPAAGTIATRLATATLGTTSQKPSWPTRLTPQPTVAIEHPRQYLGTDCVGNHWNADTDVKYDETTGKWLAITTDQAYPWSALQAYESVDGHTFTKAIITRGDYQRGARTPGQLADNQGHLALGAPTGLAYAHSTGCGQADLYLSTTLQHSLTTGAINQPLTTSAAAWTPLTGTWSISAGGYYQQTTGSSQTAASTLTGHALGGSSTITVNLRGGTHSPAGGWVGVHFDKAHPGDTPAQSGYTATVEPPIPGDTQLRLCLTKAGAGYLACRLVSGLNWTSWMRMTIAQSNGAIKVYLNGNTANGIAATDANDPYLGGYLALATNSATGHFTNLTASDNIPGNDYVDEDWSVNAGQWNIAFNGIYSDTDVGQVNLQTSDSTPFPTQLGDGTYAATIDLENDSRDPSWAGIAITNNDVTGDWRSGGYLVFLRANGKLGIFKAGAGQVVPDIPIGTRPLSGRVPVRVVKTGANFQVYVLDRPDPVVNWTDTNPPAWGIGGFGLAVYEHIFAGFVDVTYDANYAR